MLFTPLKWPKKSCSYKTKVIHRVPGGINEGFIYIYSSFCVGLYCINPLLLVKKFNKPSFIDDDIGSYKKFYNFCKSIIDYLNL